MRKFRPFVPSWMLFAHKQARPLPARLRPQPDEGYGHPQDLNAIREQQDAMQAEIKQHEQTKVETFSKYPLRLSGLILFNAFSNAGVVDNTQLPTIALPRFPGESHGSSGATLQQTLLTLDATGPRIAGARSSAEVSIDFFGGGSTNNYGYSSSGGVLRMRQTWASLDWYKTTAQVGYTVPLISPLSPTSYATVAVPVFNRLRQSLDLVTAASSGATDSNHRAAHDRARGRPHRSARLELYSPTQLDNPVEASRHPGYEGRISYRADGSWKGVARPFALGVSGYSANQLYNSATQIHSWAVTGDWQVSDLQVVWPQWRSLSRPISWRIRRWGLQRYIYRNRYGHRPYANHRRCYRGGMEPAEVHRQFDLPGKRCFWPG